MAEPEVSRSFSTRRYLDRRRNPPEYVDDELPTKTVHIFKRNLQGTAIDSNVGETEMGSIEFSGSHYDFAPGSYALRIIRQSIGVGSFNPGAGAGLLYWTLWHSREGTIDCIPFTAAGRLNQVGGPERPIYAFGPGTISVRFNPKAGTVRIFSSLEGIF